MKRWLLPLASAGVSVLLILVILLLGFLGNGSGTGYGGVVIIFVSIMICFAIVLPIMSFRYSRRCLVNQNCRIFFTRSSGESY